MYSRDQTALLLTSLLVLKKKGATKDYACNLVHEKVLELTLTAVKDGCLSNKCFEKAEQSIDQTRSME